MLDVIVAGVVTGYAIALPIGAVAAYLIGLSARTSWRIGVPAALGVATTDGLYAALAALAGGAISELIWPAEHTLRTVAAALLLVVAVISAWRGYAAYRERHGPVPFHQRESGFKPLRAYFSLILLTAVNPATVIFFSAVVIGNRTLATAPLDQQLAFALAVFCASASWQLVVALSGAALGHVVDGPRGRLATALVSSVIITAIAGYTVWG